MMLSLLVLVAILATSLSFSPMGARRVRSALKMADAPAEPAAPKATPPATEEAAEEAAPTPPAPPAPTFKELSSVSLPFLLKPKNLDGMIVSEVDFM